MGGTSLRILALLVVVILAACEVDIAPVGLRLTPAGTGPRVRFDVASNVPLPSDLVTAADPTSRTARRPSLSITGNTAGARQLRAELDAMEGWGVSAPITVGFERSETVDVRLPAIDVEAVLARMANDEHDPANDPFYVVNLSTGIPALLDVGAGYTPLTLRDPGRLVPNDRKASESNLLFESVEEGADLPFLAYTTARDRDFDGVLDHPNGLGDWYERETDTLVLRPIVPLAEMTEYAVVLTDRLRGPDGQVVRSPFEAIHHPTQRSGVARLRDWLTDNRLARYYGDIAGTGLEHVAFTWTFTTAPTREDLRVLREGLRGRGPVARIGRDFPAAVTVTQNNGCAIPSPDVGPILTGTFDTPNLLGDGRDGRFSLELQKGEGAVLHETVQWVLVLPKTTPERAAPFPVVIWIHDDGAYARDAEIYGASYARQGIAFLAFNRPGFGPSTSESCVPGNRFASSVQNAPWFSGHLAHDRDRLRQAAVDAMNLVRIVGAKKIPDVGGPIYVGGMGVGGMVASMVGATEPDVAATAPIASGGNLADTALRSASAHLDAILGPWVYSVPAGERRGSACIGEQRSIRMGGPSSDVELACLEASELAENFTVLVANVTNQTTRCELTGREGRFSIAIPTDVGDRLDVQVYSAAEVVGSYGTCRPKTGAPASRRIQTFELGAPGYEAGDRLVAARSGLGLRRQSPELRRFRDLAQAILDPADPSAFASRFMLDPIGPARPLFAAATIGDAEIPIASQLAFARAAGALPFLPPAAVERLPAYADHATPRDFYDRLGARTPMRFLVESGTAEGVARTGRTRGGPACKTNDKCGGGSSGLASSDAASCATALFDPDWVSEGALPYDEPHPDVPLRLARLAGLRITDATTLAAGWGPRLSGVPFAPDATGFTANAPVVALFCNYVEPGGAHGWKADSTCRVWDPATYGNSLVARFFATGGRDVYYLSHPSSHGCLATSTCDLFR